MTRTGAPKCAWQSIATVPDDRAVRMRAADGTIYVGPAELSMWANPVEWSEIPDGEGLGGIYERRTDGKWRWRPR